MEKNCQKIERPDFETTQRLKRIQEDCDQLKMSENTIAALKWRQTKSHSTTNDSKTGMSNSVPRGPEFSSSPN